MARSTAIFLDILRRERSTDIVRIRGAMPVTTEAPTTPNSPEAPTTTEPAHAKLRKTEKQAGSRKLSALDAATQVLQAAGKTMTTAEMIEEMSRQGLWSSPNGATPAATLYSAILREQKTKGAQARFVKTDRGKFTARAG
jgi:hypothetical protein